MWTLGGLLVVISSHGSLWLEDFPIYTGLPSIPRCLFYHFMVLLGMNVSHHHVFLGALILDISVFLVLNYYWNWNFQIQDHSHSSEKVKIEYSWGIHILFCFTDFLFILEHKIGCRWPNKRLKFAKHPPKFVEDCSDSCGDTLHIFRNTYLNYDNMNTPLKWFSSSIFTFVICHRLSAFDHNQKFDKTANLFFTYLKFVIFTMVKSQDV